MAEELLTRIHYLKVIISLRNPFMKGAPLELEAPYTTFRQLNKSEVWKSVSLFFSLSLYPSSEVLKDYITLGRSLVNLVNFSNLLKLVSCLLPEPFKFHLLPES